MYIYIYIYTYVVCVYIYIYYCIISQYIKAPAVEAPDPGDLLSNICIYIYIYI